MIIQAGESIPGVYVTPSFKIAERCARPHVVFDRDCYVRVIIEVMCDLSGEIRPINRTKEPQNVLSPVAIAISRILINPNSSVSEGEERMSEWNSSLEARPAGSVLPSPGRPAAPGLAGGPANATQAPAGASGASSEPRSFLWPSGPRRAGSSGDADFLYAAEKAVDYMQQTCPNFDTDDVFAHLNDTPRTAYNNYGIIIIVASVEDFEILEVSLPMNILRNWSNRGFAKIHVFVFNENRDIGNFLLNTCRAVSDAGLLHVYFSDIPVEHADASVAKESTEGGEGELDSVPQRWEHRRLRLCLCHGEAVGTPFVVL